MFNLSLIRVDGQYMYITFEQIRKIINNDNPECACISPDGEFNKSN